MKEIELSHLATGVPKLEQDLSVKEALKAFEEYGIYDFLVVVKKNKPIGFVNRLDLIRAQHRENIKVEELVHVAMKLKNALIRREEVLYLLDFFNSSKSPLILVDRRGNYLGVVFYQVVLHHISLFKETTIPIFQKLRSLLGQDYYFYCFYIGEIKDFLDMFGSSGKEGLQRMLYEGVKNSIQGDVSISYEEGEVYALSKTKVGEEHIKKFYEEFHREFALVYPEAKPIYLYGYCIPIKNVNNLEDFFMLSSDLKKRMKGVQEASFFIFHGEKTSVVLCEYEKREFIQHIRLKIKQDFEKIVEGLKGADRDLWEVVLYDFFKMYPYFELFYVIGESGLQVSNNVVNPRINYPVKAGKKGADRSEKGYFKKATHDDVYITNIYISQATDDFCITVSKKFSYGGKSYVLAGDINYREIHKLVRDYASKADR